MRKLQSTGRLRQGVFIAALGLFFLAIVAVGIMSTANSANKVELERTTKLARFAVDAQLKMLSAAAEANSYWDDAAAAVYSGTRRDTFFDTNWLPPTRDNPDYEAVMAYDAEGQIWRAAQNGALDKMPLKDPALSKTSKSLISQLAAGRDNVSSLFFDGGKLQILSASNIRFTNNTQSESKISGRYHRLLYRHAIDQHGIAAIGAELGITGMSFATNRPVGPAITLRNANGANIGYLSWNAPTSGVLAVRQSIPVLAAGTFLFFLVLALTARFGFALLGQLSDQALTDSLSGLPNRRALRRAIGARIADNTSHCLMLIDLDGFKNVNDRFGHVVGDRLIKSISELLFELVQKTGLVARLGGDEFAVLLNGRSAPQQIETISKEFLRRLESPIMVDGRSIWVGASMGIALSDGTNGDDGELLRRADIAMYCAKQKGKMRVEWFESHLDDEQKFANEIASELRSSLKTGDLQVVYQPIVAAGAEKSGYECQSVEALVRWTSPTHGPLGPDRFIPIAETFGLIDAIGLFVLRTACTELAKIDAIGLAVNVSAAQLRNTKFPEQLSAILEETGFSPARLELEITETYLVTDIEFARRVIADVIALGVSVSLDDFGTGYASIGFLRQFAFGKLKIDKSLVHQGMDDAAARALVQLSVAAARAMNMIVTAEGVETQAQADMMRVVGCDQLQGWHCGHPVPFNELSSAITSRIAKSTAA